MSKNKFYAVVKGRTPGIYTEWFGEHGAEVQIKGFAGAAYKGFSSRVEAHAWFANLSGERPALQGRLPLSADEDLPRRKTAIQPKPVDEKSPDNRDALPVGTVIYTDGGCSKNPGPGGYGVVILHGENRKEMSGGFARTTNNRMELTGCIKGLEALDERREVTLYTDSQYVVNGIMKGWARRWKSNNWMRNKEEAAENSDLWSQLLDLCERHDVKFQWVRGHNGNRENERCDSLAVEMTRQENLPADQGYGRK